MGPVTPELREVFACAVPGEAAPHCLHLEPMRSQAPPVEEERSRNAEQ